VEIWHIFYRFGILNQEKSGNPGGSPLEKNLNGIVLTRVARGRYYYFKNIFAKKFNKKLAFSNQN
jgi:hypothetical protein